jgi:hypothetical protein
MNHSCHILIIMTRPRITYQWKNIYKYLFVFVYFLFTELGKQRIILNRIVLVRENFKHNLYIKKTVNITVTKYNFNSILPPRQTI